MRWPNIALRAEKVKNLKFRGQPFGGNQERVSVAEEKSSGQITGRLSKQLSQVRHQVCKTTKQPERSAGIFIKLTSGSSMLLRNCGKKKWMPNVAKL